MADGVTPEELLARSTELLEEVAERAALLADVASTLPQRTDALEDIGHHLVGVKDGMELLAQAITEMPTYVELDERIRKSEARGSRARRRAVMWVGAMLGVFFVFFVALFVSNRVLISDVDEDHRCALEATVNPLLAAAESDSRVDLDADCPQNVSKGLPR